MNKDLPIASYQEAILAAVENHRVVVVTAETGAGKSTQVPQYLAEAGYSVVITQPRRLAAVSVAERVAEEMVTEFGDQVGFRTGFERCDSPETQVLFCTDGLQLVREITGSGKAQVLVIDEVHEWNLNIETLVAWARKRLAEEAPFKVVLMSATLEADKLAVYFAEVTGECPVIAVPGRLFPVEKSTKSAYELTSVVQELVKNGRNVLVFQPGKREIDETIASLNGLEAEILPLHGELDSADQRKVFRHFGRPKVIVATNVAQTSVTIDDIDAVVDSGLERRIELADGVEGLYLKPTSQADCEQRAGRAGRTKEGRYILCSGTSMDDRPVFPKAEILRSRLDQVVLRLAVAGIDASELRFFHQPDEAAVVEAKRACIALGLMTEVGQVTKLGRQAARLPVGVKVARMVLEAADRGVVGDVLTIAAIMETGSLKSRDDRWRQCIPTSESGSDALAELQLYELARQMRGDELKDYGIFAKSFFKAKELRQKIASALRGLVSFEEKGSREDVLRSVTAGMVDHLYHGRYGRYENGEGKEREIARESVFRGTSPEWIVGMPFDLQVKTRRGGMITLNLIQWVTKVDPLWLVEVAPQLETVVLRNYRYVPLAPTGSGGFVGCDEVVVFNGQEVSVLKAVGKGPEAVKAFAEALTNGVVSLPCVGVNAAVMVEVEDLNRRSGAKLGVVEASKLTEWYVSKLGEIYTLAGAQDLDLNLSDSDVSQFLSVENYTAERSRLKVERPDSWAIAGEDYALQYEWSSWSFKGVKIALPRTAIAALTANQLPSWEVASIRVMVTDEGYSDLYVTLPETGLDQLRQKIESRRRELAWQAFKANGHGDYDRKIEVAYGNSLPELPAVEVWDSEIGALAYPAWVYGSYTAGETAKSAWYCHWFQTEETASSACLTAEQKRIEVETAEDERRNFGQLCSEAQTLTVEVEALRDRIDWEKSAIYGLTSDEVNESRYGSSNGLRGQVEQARKLAFGDGYSKPQPRQAIEVLQKLRLRLQQAIDYAAENVGAEAEAEALIGQIEGWRDRLHSPCCDCQQWGDGVVYEHATYRSVFGDLAATADERYRESNYLGVVALADELKGGVAKLESLVTAFLARRQNLSTLLVAEYSVCPACGQTEWSGESESCNCLEYEEVEGDTVLKRSTLADGRLLVSVEVGGRWNQVGITIHDRQVPELSEVCTEVLWTGPSEEERSLRQRVRELEQRLEEFDRQLEDCEGDYPTRVRLKFETDSSRGTLFAIADVRELSALNNRSGDYQSVSGAVRFTCDPSRCRWLEQSPSSGQEWVCSWGKMIGRDGKGRPVIIANPQARVDAAARQAIEREIALLRGEAVEETAAATSDDIVEVEISDEDWRRLLERFGRR